MARNPSVGLNAASFISQFIKEGLSATAGLEKLREMGMGITTSRWYGAWGEVRSALGNAERLAGVDYGLPLRDEHFTDWAAGRPGQRMIDVDLVIHDRLGDVDYRRRYSVFTEDELSPLDAIEQAISDWEDEITPGGSGEGQTILGGVLVGAYNMTGR